MAFKVPVDSIDSHVGLYTDSPIDLDMPGEPAHYQELHVKKLTLHAVCISRCGARCNYCQRKTAVHRRRRRVTGHVLVRQGECSTRVTPASTFKVAISLMGFDSGFLKDEHSPTLPYRNGYPDWGGAAWREPTDPARWIKLSVVWFSQRVAQALGQERFQQYTTAFGYGNADVTSTTGELNGVMGAWINSSLRISPLEQVDFMRKIVNRTLPIKEHAYDMTEHVTMLDAQPGGWVVHGKTGTGSPGPRYDPAHAYGWFVGWATKGSRTLVFANLIQDEQRDSPPAGIRSRDAFLGALPALAAATSQQTTP